MKSSFLRRLINAPYLLWSAIFIIVPLVIVAYYALTDESGNYTLSYILNIGEYKEVFIRSLVYAVIATLITLVMSYPVAYYISRSTEKMQNILVLIITIPTWINMLVRTYAWRGILLNVPISAEMKVLIGMVYNFIPFMILQIYTSLSKMDKSLLQAASDLGADGIQSFLRVTLPLSIPGVVSGITLVFLPTVSSFFIPKLLGGGDYVLIGNLIENYFVSTGDWNFGSAISLIMAVIIMVSMYLTKKIDKDVEGQK